MTAPEQNPAVPRTAAAGPGGPRRSAASLAAVGVAVALAAAGCSDNGPSSGSVPSAGPGSTAVVDPGDGGAYRATVTAADLQTTIDNPWFPARPGARWVYEGTSDGAEQRVEVEVLPETRMVMGVAATVVRDRVYEDGELVEDTLDWYAQDREGNVWYLGEDVKDYEGGVVVSTAGSWEAGVGGALPGIAVLATPDVGDVYRQEYLAGEAEDMVEVLAVDGRVEVPFGAFDGVLTTEDWTPLEPDVVEEKDYAFGIGRIRERNVAGGDGRSELVDFVPAP